MNPSVKRIQSGELMSPLSVDRIDGFHSDRKKRETAVRCIGIEAAIVEKVPLESHEDSLGGIHLGHRDAFGTL